MLAEELSLLGQLARHLNSTSVIISPSNSLALTDLAYDFRGILSERNIKIESAALCGARYKHHYYFLFTPACPSVCFTSIHEFVCLTWKLRDSLIKSTISIRFRLRLTPHLRICLKNVLIWTKILIFSIFRPKLIGNNILA